MTRKELTSDRVPTSCPKEKKSGQGIGLVSEEIYAVKPGVPREDERTEHKGSMRVDDDELTATLVATRSYIVECKCEEWRIYLSTNKHNTLAT